MNFKRVKKVCFGHFLTQVIRQLIELIRMEAGQLLWVVRALISCPWQSVSYWGHEFENWWFASEYTQISCPLERVPTKANERITLEFWKILKDHRIFFSQLQHAKCLPKAGNLWIRSLCYRLINIHSMRTALFSTFAIGTFFALAKHELDFWSQIMWLLNLFRLLLLAIKNQQNIHPIPTRSRQIQ